MKFYQFNNFKENAIVFAENEGDAKRIYYKHFDKIDSDRLKNPEVIDIDEMFASLVPYWRDFEDLLKIVSDFYFKTTEIIKKEDRGKAWLY